jgi:hypothetical protein
MVGILLLSTVYLGRLYNILGSLKLKIMTCREWINQVSYGTVRSHFFIIFWKSLMLKNLLNACLIVCMIGLSSSAMAAEEISKVQPAQQSEPESSRIFGGGLGACISGMSARIWNALLRCLQASLSGDIA